MESKVVGAVIACVHDESEPDKNRYIAIPLDRSGDIEIHSPALFHGTPDESRNEKICALFTEAREKKAATREDVDESGLAGCRVALNGKTLVAIDPMDGDIAGGKRKIHAAHGQRVFKATVIPNAQGSSSAMAVCGSIGSFTLGGIERWLLSRLGDVEYERAMWRVWRSGGDVYVVADPIEGVSGTRYRIASVLPYELAETAADAVAVTEAPASSPAPSPAPAETSRDDDGSPETIRALLRVLLPQRTLVDTVARCSAEAATLDAAATGAVSLRRYREAEEYLRRADEERQRAKSATELQRWVYGGR